MKQKEGILIPSFWSTCYVAFVKTSRFKHENIGFQSNMFYGIRQLQEDMCAILFDFFLQCLSGRPCEIKTVSNNGPPYVQSYNNSLHLLSLSEPLIDFPFCT